MDNQQLLLRQPSIALLMTFRALSHLSFPLLWKGPQNVKAMWLNKLAFFSFFFLLILYLEYFPILVNILRISDFYLLPIWPVYRYSTIYLNISNYLLATWLFHLHYDKEPCDGQPSPCPWYTFLPSSFTQEYLLCFSYRDYLCSPYCVFHLPAIR